MRRRILGTIVIVAALAVLAFFVPTALAMRSSIQHSDLLELQREASIVASRIAPSGPIDLDAISDAIDPDHQLALYDNEGRLVAGVGPEIADDIVRVGVDGTFDEGYVGGDLVAAVPVRPGPSGPGLVVRIREPGSESNHRVVVRTIWLALAAVGIIGIAAAVGWLLARRLSKPVEDLRERASALGHADDVGRPALTGISELDELSSAMTEASDRIRELLRRERSFSSHVSHQLRTPVAALRVAIEGELEAPRPDNTDVLHESLLALERLESTIASLLALARHDEREPSMCDVAQLVRDHVDHWTMAFEAADRTVSVNASSATVKVDPASITHIVDVLLDNALAHGRGPVVVTTRSSGGRVEIDVADDGPAVAGSDPFSEQRTDSGHGIGLRLARTLAESEGGDLTQLPARHTVFRLTLPVQRSHEHAYLANTLR